MRCGLCERAAAAAVTGGSLVLLMCDEHASQMVALAGDNRVTARYLRRRPRRPRRRPA